MNKNGFTLAEVLITLGIIGIIAAITLPTIIGKYQKKAASSKLKKLFVTLENAIRLTEMQEANTRDQWAFNSIKERDSFIKEKLIPNLNCLKVMNELGNSNLRQSPICIFKDGSIISFHINNANSTKAIEIFFILNTNALYNNNLFFGKNAFYYSIPLYRKNIPITSTRETLLQTCKPTKNNIYTDDSAFDYSARDCLKLIQYDGWEIKNDYPW